jgi:hypothetical protein
MKSGKLLRISDDRSIYIIENDDDSYITNDKLISYRNIGKSFDIAVVEKAYVDVGVDQQVHVLDAVGNSKFHFPMIWLNTNMMKLYELQEMGLIKLKDK